MLFSTDCNLDPGDNPGGTSILRDRGGGGGRLGPDIKSGGMQGRAKFTERVGKFGLHKTQKLGKIPNFGVISELQSAKFRVFVTYIFGGKIWDSNKNFRGKF